MSGACSLQSKYSDRESESRSKAERLIVGALAPFMFVNPERLTVTAATSSLRDFPKGGESQKS